MVDAIQFERLTRGAKSWNAWRGTQNHGLDLAGAEASDLNLGAVNLSDMNLSGTRWSRANLANANFSGAVLRDADFVRTELSGAKFADADLVGAIFYDANLRGADLSSLRQPLNREALAGADLTGAKLPELLSKRFEAAEFLKLTSEGAKKIFLLLVGACLYCWISVGTTSDVNLLINQTSAPLPIVQTSVPIVGFFLIGPLLILSVYFYFNFYLQRLWEEFAAMPAILPSGAPLYASVDPWLLNDLIRAQMPRLPNGRPLLSRLQLWIAIGLAWWTVPLTVAMFWARFLTRHDLLISSFHVLMLSGAITSALGFHRLALDTLQRRPTLTTSALSFRSLPVRSAVRFFTITSVLVLFSAGVIWGQPSGHPLWRSAAPGLLEFFGYQPFANLDEGELSTLSPGANATTTKITGARLTGFNLRYAHAAAAGFEGAHANHTIWTGADLRRADFRFSELEGADFRGANLLFAQFQGANLKGVKFEGANLQFATFCHATNLDPAALRKGLNWRDATLDKETTVGLSLPTDNNRRVFFASGLTMVQPSDLDPCGPRPMFIPPLQGLPPR